MDLNEKEIKKSEKTKKQKDLNDMIVNKLNVQLEKEITDVSQVVYILSLVRKILENENYPDKFCNLLFFCHWALHIKIDKTKGARKMIQSFVNDPLGSDFLQLSHFYDDFKAFIEKHNLSRNIFDKDNYLRFVNLLIDVYEEIPIEISSDEYARITLSKFNSKIKNSVFSVTFKIEHIV